MEGAWGVRREWLGTVVWELSYSGLLWLSLLSAWPLPQSRPQPQGS